WTHLSMFYHKVSSVLLNHNASSEAKYHGKSQSVVTNTIMWRFATLFASNCVLGKESWHAFLERLFLSRALQASLVSGAKYDSLANYASSTTFGHIMVN